MKYICSFLSLWILIAESIWSLGILSEFELALLVALENSIKK